ncbi:protein kinase superfamily protein [Tasmannia lanceolata]|uniref:protein kinase superfamily protein n=1 Tax=Tasmannia lanceolata TaxID=3420 RepID=UPI00406423C9
MDPKLQALIAASISFIIVGLICFLVVLICNKTKTRKQRRPNPNSTPLYSFHIDESASFDPSLRQVSMADLISATRNFAGDGIIGDGSFGFVYKARLPSGVTVAVKKLSLDAFQGFREFRAEIETLGKISSRNPNLVRILGYCISGSDRVLIYDYFENGSLDQWLHDTLPERVPLSWANRAHIIEGVASGIAFLHNESDPKIIHRDIKASNILLSSGFEARIADFGLARRVEGAHSHVSTQVAGTMGYMPPEYKDGITIATVKADVYSFGVLMLEVATGKRPNLPVLREGGKDVWLVEWARRMVGLNRHMEMLDDVMSKEGLVSEGEGADQVKKFFHIACLCTSENSRERPTMEEVVSLLAQILVISLQ